MRPEDADELVARFIEATADDPRIEAAFVYGSHAAGTADEHSDLDLGIVPAGGFQESVVADARRIVEALGMPLLIAVFDDPGTLHVTLASGAYVELIIHRADELDITRPHRVLFDRVGVVAQATGGNREAAGTTWEAEGIGQLLEVFWHDVEHLATALARGQRWWAYGQLDEVRRLVIALLRIEAGAAAEDEAYWKLDSELPADRLAALERTAAPPDLAPMAGAALALLELFRSVGSALADRYGAPYPNALDRLMSRRLDALAQVSRGEGAVRS